MENIVAKELIKILFISIIHLMLVFLMIKIYVSIIFENRIKAFCLEDNDNNEYSLIDILKDKLFNIVKCLSNYLRKSHVINDYANKYNKYFVYNERKELHSIDFVSLKFLVMIAINLLYFVSILLGYNKFNFFILLLVSIISFFICDIFLVSIFNRKKSLMSEQLLEAVVIMNSAFKSGKNILEAIKIVKAELPNPIKTEFSIIYNDLSYGISVREAFTRFENRVLIDEAKLITSSLALLSKTGGNIVTVFNMIEKNFYDRLRIKSELSSLTATSKLLYKVLLIIPFILTFVIILLNPLYFTPLITTKVGVLIIGFILILYVIYVIIIKKVMKVDEL